MTTSGLVRSILRCIVFALWLGAPLAQAHAPFADDGFSPVEEDSTRIPLSMAAAAAVPATFRFPGVESAKAGPTASPCQGGGLCDGCTDCCAQANGGHCSVCGHGVAGPSDFIWYPTSRAALRSAALSCSPSTLRFPIPDLPALDSA